MALSLTTPLSVGDLDSGTTYAEVKIVMFMLCSADETIRIECEYGNTVSGSWVPGIRAGNAANQSFIIQDIDGGTSHYTDMIANTSAAASENYYDEVATLLYQWLIDESHFAGTIT